MPEAMGTMMARFFGNFLPFMALLWTLDAFLVYRILYHDVFYIGALQKPAPSLACLALVIFFLLLPIRTCINRCYSGFSHATDVPYSKSQTTFITDYDIMNPVTKTEGLVRFMNARLSNASTEEEKAALQS